jgi:hypothetical protein
VPTTLSLKYLDEPVSIQAVFVASPVNLGGASLIPLRRPDCQGIRGDLQVTNLRRIPRSIQGSVFSNRCWETWIYATPGKPHERKRHARLRLTRSQEPVMIQVRWEYTLPHPGRRSLTSIVQYEQAIRIKPHEQKLRAVSELVKVGQREKA